MIKAQTRIILSAGNKSMTATLTANSATETLTAMLSEAPVTIMMEDYGGFEKVGELPRALPTSNSQITTVPGDIMLYQGNNIVIFYASNSWSYTRLGKIDGATATNLQEFLGNGDVSLTLSLSSNADVPLFQYDKVDNEKIYDLEGRLITSRPIPPGIYVVNGKKRLIK